MTFKEYQTQALTTARYPQDYRIFYPLLKLGGEIGEVSEKVGKVLRDNNGDFSGKEEAIALEIGDVLWYIATFSHEIKISLEFPEITKAEDIILTTLNLQRLQGKLVGRVFETWEDSFPPAITRLLKEILRSAGEISHLLGYTLIDIAQLNLDKLSSRKQRGVIGGSRDDR
jgi:NTP pyrophosphatase (non-canonical NTP hydrolase)